MQALGCRVEAAWLLLCESDKFGVGVSEGCQNPGLGTEQHRGLDQGRGDSCSVDFSVVLVC